MKLKQLGAAVVALTLAGTGSAYAFDLTDIFGDNSTVSNLIQGVLSKSDLEVSDLAGEWTVNGSAVCFKSDNFLQKAGGVAAAATVEGKLDPYFQRYGLTGGVITIQTNGDFAFKMKRLSLSGVIAKNSDGNFDFTFKAMGKMNIGTMTAYVQKTSSQLEIMFDATKLETILSAVAKVSGSNLAKTATSLLSSYDGICVGFKTTKTGSVEGESNSTGNAIIDALTGRGSSSSSSTSTQSTTTTQEEQSTSTTTSSEEQENSVSSKASGLLQLLKGATKK